MVTSAIVFHAGRAGLVEPTARPVAAPDDHLVPGPHRGMANTRRRRVFGWKRFPDSSDWIKAGGVGLIRATLKPQKVVHSPKNNHFTAGPYGGVAGSTGRIGGSRDPGICCRAISPACVYPRIFLKNRSASPDDHFVARPNRGRAQARVRSIVRAGAGPGICIGMVASAGEGTAIPKDHLLSRPNRRK